MKCYVGLNNETQAMECEGSWEKTQDMMKEKLGDKWTELQTNMTTGMTGIIETFKESFNPDKIIGAIQSAITPTSETRRRREAGEDSEPEPEPEPEDDYYCIKQSVAGHTLKSCLPKVNIREDISYFTKSPSSLLLTRSR